MTDAEQRAFRSFLRPEVSCLEFGCGGSTLAAATSVGRLVSVDSSAEWMGKVRDALAAACVTAAVTLRVADIGPVGEGGYPSDLSRQREWGRYHSEVWDHEDAEVFDLVLVDGRFRVGCFLQAALRCRGDALILLHDYAPRPDYHVVARVAREVFREGALSGFVRRTDFDRALALDLLERHREAPG